MYWSTLISTDVPNHRKLFSMVYLVVYNSRFLPAVPKFTINTIVLPYRNDTIAVEENIGQIFFDVTRSQGLDGTISVDLTTQPDTAVISTDPKQVTLSPLETVITSQVTGWHSFYSNDSLYLVMLTSYRVGELTTGIGSAGNDSTYSVDRYLYSTLFKWQGQLVPVQVSGSCI